MKAAAMQIAEKRCAPAVVTIATRRQSLSLPKMFSILWRFL